MTGVDRRHFLAAAAATALVGRVGTSKRRTPIDEAGFVPVGGIQQWVAIRGEDRARPALLFLHGGPAEAQSPFRESFAAWEARYVVAQWDQRGAGKTFGRTREATPDLTLDRLTADVAIVARHVGQRLGARRIALVGHSWGAILGLAAVRRFPEEFAGLIASGFPTSWMLTVEWMRSYALQQARVAKNDVAIVELERLGSLDPAKPEQLGVILKWRRAYTPASDSAYLASQGRFAASGSADAADWNAGGGFSLPKLLPILTTFDARADGLELRLPFHVIQGRDDNVTSPPAARAFVADLKAPRKSYLDIEGGHFACFTSPLPFVEALERTGLLP